jgi:hypothetical protein
MDVLDPPIALNLAGFDASVASHEKAFLTPGHAET